MINLRDYVHITFTLLLIFLLVGLGIEISGGSLVMAELFYKSAWLMLLLEVIAGIAVILGGKE